MPQLTASEVAVARRCGRESGPQVQSYGAVFFPELDGEQKSHVVETNDGNRR